MKPTLLDLFCGRGGWSKAAAALGWQCIGIDHVEYDYPGHLILRPLPIAWEDLLSFNPNLIVASPPCEQYARHHLPWIKDPAPPDETLLRWSISLIGRGVPVIVECSRFAARHVQADRFAFPYALWGDIPALLPPNLPPKPDPGGRRVYANARKAEKRAEINATLADWLIDFHDPRKKRN